jgi:multidrug resistance protein MdtO
MATRVTEVRGQSIPGSVSWHWLREFLRWELAPYPGRVDTVVRMTLTVTLVMIAVVTFRIPNAFLAALFSILIVREDLIATWRGARMVVLGFAFSSIYILLGMMLFRGFPITHFFWVIGSLYLVFFVMRTTTNYGAAWAFVIPIGISLPVWDRPLSSQAQVEDTLWPVLIIAVGACVSLGVEALHRIFDHSDPLIAFVDDLLLAVQQVAENTASMQALPKSVLDRVHQYRMIGTGRLRVTLQRQGLDPTRRAQRAALIALAARLMNLAADLEHNHQSPSAGDASRLRALAARLGIIRVEFRESGVISACPRVLEERPSSSYPILQDMERTVALMTEVFQDNAIVNASQAKPGWRSLFLPDAFENPEYLRFAFAGCLAATVCYVLYNALDWPGIFISVLTCIVTALTTIGNSLQARFLRLAGFVAGGLIMGISAQILILPSLDSVFGFAIFFAVGSAIAAWFATSSPRLSFFGVQMALAFYFVNMQDAHIQTDLTIARDKVIGVLVGILAMGFIFDRLVTKSDAEHLQKLLVRNIQMLAELLRCSVGCEKAIAISQIGRLRSQINDNFANLESQMEAARFEVEFRHRGEREMIQCQLIQRTQPWLRSIYLLELSLLSHRARRENGSQSSLQQIQALDHFLIEYSDRLGHIARWIAGEEEAPAPIFDNLRLSLQTSENDNSTSAQVMEDICQKMVSSFLMLRSEC